MSARSVDPAALIEAYVLDVTKRLPRKQRNDVAFELRALLTEGLRDHAADAGRPPDEAMALDFVRAFGRPENVAARYSAPRGEPIIPPAHNAGFALATIIGIAAQWAVSLPMAFTGPLPAGASESTRITAWWLSYGLGAFWWPGFMISMAMIAGFIRQRWPAAPEIWKPRIVDRDHVNRPLYMLGLAGALAGIGLWVFIAWYVTTSSSHFAQALALDPDFLATRAPLLLLQWAAGVVVLAILIIEGRRRQLTRRLNVATQITAALLMLWFILGGRIFVGDAADQTTKGALGLIIALVVLQLALDWWNGRSRIRTPDVNGGEVRGG